jgi:hypothetical protein
MPSLPPRSLALTLTHTLVHAHTRVQVIMVTGDHPITAKAIAKSIHIIRDPCPEDLAEADGLIDGSKVRQQAFPLYLCCAAHTLTHTHTHSLMST